MLSLLLPGLLLLTSTLAAAPPDGTKIFRLSMISVSKTPLPTYTMLLNRDRSLGGNTQQLKCTATTSADPKAPLELPLTCAGYTSRQPIAGMVAKIQQPEAVGKPGLVGDVFTQGFNVWFDWE